MIASRYKSLGTHIASGSMSNNEIAKLMMGNTPTVGSIVALLLILENTPYMTDISDREIAGHEARLSWNLVRLAHSIKLFIRAGPENSDHSGRIP